MEVTEESLRQRYSSMDTEELVKFYREETLYLSKTASDVIEKILMERDVTIEDRGKIIIEQLEKEMEGSSEESVASPKERHRTGWSYWLLVVLALGLIRFLMRLAADDPGAKEVVGKMGKVIDQVLTPPSVSKKETEINPYQAYLKYLELQRHERDRTSGKKNKTEKKAGVVVAWTSGYTQGIQTYHINRGVRPSDIFLEDIARKSLLESLHTGKSNISDPTEYVNDFKEGFDEGWDQCRSAMQEE